MRSGPVSSVENGPEVTIAITVFDRRRYIHQAVRSALEQTVAARVVVVEDCGPDPGLQQYVMAEFEGRVDYVRNVSRRGLFGNWNACLELCSTRWLSILHDDDYLRPCFVASVLAWQRGYPGRGVYFGDFDVVNERGEVVAYPREPVPGEVAAIDLKALMVTNMLGFPGHILDVALARALGGFRESSQFCGDWEMWFKLVASRGGMRGGAAVACVRFYDDVLRGTSKVLRSGRCFGLTIVQRRRNRGFIERLGLRCELTDERMRQQGGPFPSFLLVHAWGFAPRWARYNAGLFLRGRGGGGLGWVLRWVLRVFGVRGLVWLSRIYHTGCRLRRRAQLRGGGG